MATIAPRFRATCIASQKRRAILWARQFTTPSSRLVRVGDIPEQELPEVKVNRERLWKELQATCEWGRGERWGPSSTDVGMSRLALSDTDKQARDWFVETMKSLGCTVHVDSIGSHLDTQPTGGRYDGILDIHAGVEVMRVLAKRGLETEYTTGVINWTNF